MTTKTKKTKLWKQIEYIVKVDTLYTSYISLYLSQSYSSRGMVGLGVEGKAVMLNDRALSCTLKC